MADTLIVIKKNKITTPTHYHTGITCFPGMFLPILGDFDSDERAGELAGDLQNTILDDCNGSNIWPLSGRLAALAALTA